MKNKTIRKILAGMFLLTLPLFAASYTNNGNGTVTDSATNLVWQQCSMGQNQDATCSGTATNATWQNAMDYCENLSLAGKEWRLPSANELKTIVDKSKSAAPYIDTTYFPSTLSNYYWSSTTYLAATANAWVVYFANGNVPASSKAANYYVRCVSSGP